MGHEVYYQTRDRHISSVSIRRWAEMSRLLPLLLDYVNRASALPWGAGTFRSVAVFSGGSVPPALPTPEEAAPAPGQFGLARMLSQESIAQNELFILDAAEWKRFFAWCAFLGARDGVFTLYGPLVEALRLHFGVVTEQEQP